jgi:hypothetical protein
MRPRSRPFSPLALALAGLFSAAVVSGGCEGDPGASVTDAGIERPTATGGSGGTPGPGTGGRGGGGVVMTPDARPMPDAPPPAPNPAAVKIMPGQTDLLGGFQTGCTTGAGAERWCAVSRPLSLARRELWLINVSKAAASKTNIATCDTPGLCVKASDQLYTAQPDVGPAYPLDSAEASGNTFIYLTDPISTPTDSFQGDIWAHTVGAPNATKIGDDVFDCVVGGQRYIEQGRRLINKVVGICAGDESSPEGQMPPFFTLSGGVVAGQQTATAGQQTALPTPMTALLPKIQKIYPAHPQTGSGRYRVGFTPDGENLVLSHAGPTLAETENLTLTRTDDLGKPEVMATPVPGLENISRWSLSADGKKIYYLKEYNYNAMGNQAGTLAVADFPSGANAKEIKSSRVPSGPMGGVGLFRVLVNNLGVDSGVGVMTGLGMARGNYTIVKDPNGSLEDAANVVPVVMRSGSLPLPSPDLRFSMFSREENMDFRTTDIWVIKNDGSMDCALTAGNLGDLFGAPFPTSAGLMFWADNFDPATQSAEGWLTDPGDCRNPGKKKQWSRNVDFWFIDGDRLLLYSDESNGAQVSLKYAFLNGSTLGPSTTIQTRADRAFRIILDAYPAGGGLPRFKGVVYTLSGGGEDINGVYYYELPTSDAPRPAAGDAGTGTGG